MIAKVLSTVPQVLIRHDYQVRAHIVLYAQAKMAMDVELSCVPILAFLSSVAFPRVKTQRSLMVPNG